MQATILKAEDGSIFGLVRVEAAFGESDEFVIFHYAGESLGHGRQWRGVGSFSPLTTTGMVGKPRDDVKMALDFAYDAFQDREIRHVATRNQ